MNNQTMNNPLYTFDYRAQDAFQNYGMKTFDIDAIHIGSKSNIMIELKHICKPLTSVILNDERLQFANKMATAIDLPFVMIYCAPGKLPNSQLMTKYKNLNQAFRLSGVQLTSYKYWNYYVIALNGPALKVLNNKPAKSFNELDFVLWLNKKITYIPNSVYENLSVEMNQDFNDFVKNTKKTVLDYAAKNFTIKS